METPFVFGRIACDANFTDREAETAHLVSNFKSLINTIIISPRRWGKSSLVHKASKVAMQEDNNLKICHIDLFNVRDEAGFYATFAQEILKATSSRWEEMVENAKRFFTSLVPKITSSSATLDAVSIGFNWEDVSANPEEVLNLAETIAKEKNIRIVVCIDEFQKVAEFSDAAYFQRRLRASWQYHQHVAYCLFGSKRSMMLEVFANSSMPFYKFGDMMFLGKIPTTYLVPFIHQRFRDTRKEIEPAASAKIVALADNHPYYVQQLAQLSWLRTQETCTTEIVGEAHSALVEQLSLLFIAIVETLTNQQLNYLNALMSGETKLTSTEVMAKYRISSATSTNRSQKALIQKDILDNSSGKISMQDPIFAYWLKSRYFGLVKSEG